MKTMLSGHFVSYMVREQCQNIQIDKHGQVSPKAEISACLCSWRKVSPTADKKEDLTCCGLTLNFFDLIVRFFVSVGVLFSRFLSFPFCFLGLGSPLCSLYLLDFSRLNTLILKVWCFIKCKFPEQNRTLHEISTSEFHQIKQLYIRTITSACQYFLLVMQGVMGQLVPTSTNPYSPSSSSFIRLRLG